MKVRTAVKALIVENGKLLLIRCQQSGEAYYALPGGGQEPLEPLDNAVIRECLEETGYTVSLGPLVFLCEEINTNPEAQTLYPDYCHRQYWYFQCGLEALPRREDSRPDEGRTGFEWADAAGFHGLELVPAMLKQPLRDWLARPQTGSARFLGTVLQYEPPSPQRRAPARSNGEKSDLKS